MTTLFDMSRNSVECPLSIVHPSKVLEPYTRVNMTQDEDCMLSMFLDHSYVAKEYTFGKFVDGVIELKRLVDGATGCIYKTQDGSVYVYCDNIHTLLTTI